MDLSPQQCRAARGLLDWTQERLATLAGVSRSTIRDFECHKHSLHRGTEEQIIRTLQDAGVILLPPGEYGPGVRIK